MIFVTVGTHVQFTRLIKQIDKIAPKIKEKIIIQRGSTPYIPKNCESFEWATSLDPYFKKARLIISHAGLTAIEAARSHMKPTIAVPRQYKYGEHINDHQVESAKSIEKKYGFKTVYDIKDLTPELVKNYNKVLNMEDKNLRMLQAFMKKVILQFEKEKS